MNLGTGYPAPHDRERVWPHPYRPPWVLRRRPPGSRAVLKARLEERTGTSLLAAFQGAPGAFSEEALRTYFEAEGLPHQVEPLPCRSFTEVVAAVQEGRADYGVLPVENTLAGSVTGSYDALAEGRLSVIGEVIRPIRHCLLGLPGTRVEDLRRIVSHPVALAQCTRFLSSHPKAESIAVYDTAGGAMQVAEGGDPTMAAVASRGAGERYGLQVLAADIQDRDDNQTRFYIVQTEGKPRPESHSNASGHKTVMVIEVEDRPGSLLDILEPFARRRLNLSKLASRPSAAPWRYRFLLEVQANAEDEAMSLAVREVEAHASSVRVLGSFPAAPRD